VSKDDMSDMTARTILRVVLHAINDFRDSRRAEMIRAKNRLLLTIFVTSLLAYGIEVVVLFAGAPPANLLAAILFFFVGATVGLMDRLRREAKTSSAVDDFGLFEARLLHTPLLSGLAAVGGVLLVNVAPALATALSASPGTGVDAVSLAKVYDLSNVGGILVAGVFGLTPGVFFDGLQKQTDVLRKDLESTTTSG
jgi:hypothetical protein